MIKFNHEEGENESGDLIGLRLALPVGPVPKDFDPEIPPTTGNEFILHVVHESKKFGPVFTAKEIDESVRNVRGGNLPVKSAIHISKNAPALDWQTEQVNLFSKLRSRTLKLRLRHGARNTGDFIVPSLADPDTDWLKFMSENEPLLTVLFALRQELLERALNCLTNASISLEQGAWVYAITANLDHPLSREACADLRDIARRCAQLRDNSVEGKTAEEITMLNLIITIVVEYFQQKDLCED